MVAVTLCQNAQKQKVADLSSQIWAEHVAAKLDCKAPAVGTPSKQVSFQTSARTMFLQSNEIWELQRDHDAATKGLAAHLAIPSWSL